ncbi:MAG: hypothetical protein NT141_02050 [candidate division WWE3 bacterium]|nr:hypothetical protein [candidate division WWE3 bacterium]
MNLITKAYAVVIDPGMIGVKNITPESGIMMVVKALIGACGFGAFIFLIIGGVKFVVSAGDKGAVESAKKTITFAVIGLVLAAAAFAIASLLQNVLGINILNVTI